MNTQQIIEAKALEMLKQHGAELNEKNLNEAKGYALQNLIVELTRLAEQEKLELRLRTNTFGETVINFAEEYIEQCPFNSEKGGKAACVPSSTHSLKIITVR